MKVRNKRKIIDVFNCETGEDINANDFFKKPIDEIVVYRSILKDVILGNKPPLFKCHYCRQIVRIRGGKESINHRKPQIFHFAHLKDTDECPYKTNYHLTKEDVDRIKYNGQPESILHKKLKAQIAKCLTRNKEIKGEVTIVEVENRIVGTDSKEWKQPDINACFNKKRIAFELQLSTTWLDVITKRQNFYREQGIFIIWIFHSFNFNDYSRRLTYNDVIFTNNQNAYIFDNEAYEYSKIENDLILKCFYKVYSRNGLELKDEWEHAFIKLSDMTFDENAIRVFYYDSENQKKIVKKEIAEQIAKLNQLKESEILKNHERIRKRRELSDKIEKLTLKIDEIKKRQKKIKSEISQTKAKIEEKFELLKNVKYHAEIALEYFSNGSKYFSPFYSNDDLFEILKEQFQEKIWVSAQILRTNKETYESAKTRLERIHKFEKKEITGISYSCINNLTHWDFIKRNYSQIRIIPKNFVNENDMFALEYINVIKNRFDLSHLQFSKEILFLMDFTMEIAKLQEISKNSQEVILNSKNHLEKVKKEMENVIENHFKEKIVEKQKELKTQEYNEENLKEEFSTSNAKLLRLTQLDNNDYS